MPRHKLTALLVLLAVSMFGFGFALVPLYDVFCQVTGINGKPSNQPSAVIDAAVQKQRKVTVQFMAHVHPDMPWVFEPEVHEVQVSPGEMKRIHFNAENLKNDYVVGQAIPSISPGSAALYFHKTACFCFNQQQLSPLARAEMPLVFYIDPDLPSEITTLTLSYTLYDVSDKTLASLTQHGVSHE